MPADVSPSAMKMVTNLKDSASPARLFDNNQVVSGVQGEEFSRQMDFQSKRIQLSRESQQKTEPDTHQARQVEHTANHEKTRNDSGKNLPKSNPRDSEGKLVERRSKTESVHPAQANSSDIEASGPQGDRGRYGQDHPEPNPTLENASILDQGLTLNQGDPLIDNTDSELFLDSMPENYQISESEAGLISQTLDADNLLLENIQEVKQLLSEQTLEGQIQDAELIESQLQLDRGMLAQLTTSQLQSRVSRLDALQKELQVLAQTQPELKAAIDALKEKFELLSRGELDVKPIADGELGSEQSLDDLIAEVVGDLALDESLGDQLKSTLKAVLQNDLEQPVAPLVSRPASEESGSLQEKLAALISPVPGSLPDGKPQNNNIQHETQKLTQRGAEIGQLIQVEGGDTSGETEPGVADSLVLLEKKLTRSSDKEGDLLLKNMSADSKIFDQKVGELKLSDLLKSGDLSLGKLKEVTESLNNSVAESNSKPDSTQSRITATPMMPGVTKPGEPFPNSSGKVFQTTMQNHFTKPNWTPELGQRLMMMVGQKIQVAEIRLDPPDLGPMEVKVRMQQDQAHVVFNSQHAVVRDTLEQAIPRLRELFEQNGLSLGDVDVQDQSAQQQEGENSEGANGSLMAAADGEDQEQAENVTVIQSDKLVDYYA